MLGKEAITKIQAIILAAIIIVAVIGGIFAYYYSGGAFTEKKLRAIPEAEIKAAFIYLGPTAGVGWSCEHERARTYLTQVFPKITVAKSESVPTGDYPRVMNEYISKGYNVIITDYDFETMDPTYSVALSNPSVYFAHCAGLWHEAPNALTYYGRIYQAVYCSGIVGGFMTKTNKIGFVGAFPSSNVLLNINAFTLGARSVNPNVTVHASFTYAWYDPSAEKAAAEGLLALGCDVLTQHCDSAAVQIAAQQAGAYSLGYQGDMSAFAPDAYLTGAIWNWKPEYEHIIRSIINGTWKNEWLYWGIDEGTVGFGPWNPIVPKNVTDYVENIRNEMATGTLPAAFPFVGPLSDRDGNVKYAAGYTPTDLELYGGTHWVVAGVVGSIPAE